MDTFVRRFQPERYELWKIGKDIGPHPEDHSRVSHSRQRLVILAYFFFPFIKLLLKMVYYLYIFLLLFNQISKINLVSLIYVISIFRIVCILC